MTTGEILDLYLPRLFPCCVRQVKTNNDVGWFLMFEYLQIVILWNRKTILSVPETSKNLRMEPDSASFLEPNIGVNV